MKPIIIIGGGGHAKVLINTLKLTNCTIIGFTDISVEKDMILGVMSLGNDNVVFQYNPSEIRLVNGIGSVKETYLRRKIFEEFSDRCFQFLSIVHPGAIIAHDIHINQGIQVMAGAIIQPGCRIGRNTLINTRASIDHDCYIGEHVHIAPGAVLSGGVQIGEGVHVGTGAIVIQGIKVGNNSIIGAGAVVTRDVPEGAIVVGVPAKEAKY